MTKDPTVEKWDDFENGNFARGLTRHNGQFCGDFQMAKIIVKSILIIALSPYLISLSHFSTIVFFQAVFYMEQIYSKMLLGSIDVYTGRKNIFNSSKSMSNMKKMLWFAWKVKRVNTAFNQYLHTFANVRKKVHISDNFTSTIYL